MPDFGDLQASIDVEPARKRPRVLSKACETCKSRKSKCDSGRPQCETCRRKGFDCVYREKGQPGLRPGYGKAIESRLSTLEANMDKIRQSLETLTSSVQFSQSQSQAAAAAAAASTSLAATGPVLSPVETDISMMPVVQPSPGATAPETTSTANAPPQLWPNNPGPQQPLPHMDASSFAASPAALGVSGCSEVGIVPGEFPPHDVLDEIVDMFFELVYPWAPLFYQPHFRAKMFEPGRDLLLHGMVALVFRFWTKPAPPADVREGYAKASRDHVLFKTVDMCSLTSTQALALLAIDTLGQGPGPKTWNVMSMLVTAARHLGLARSPVARDAEVESPLVRNEDPAEDLNLPVIEAEEKRRLFWVIFSIDRLSSASHGQHGGTDSKTIRLPYPASDDDWDRQPSPEWFQPAWLGGQARLTHDQQCSDIWHHYIDILVLLDRSNQLLIQNANYSLPALCREWQSGFRRLDMLRSTWFECLPAEVREQPASFNAVWLLLHATFHLIGIRMYTVAAFPSTNSPHLRPSPSARVRCRQAVKEVAALTDGLRAHELRRLGPMFAFAVWVAARSLIILWTTGYESTYGSMLPADLERLVDALRQMAVWWPCARRYVDLVQLILDTRDEPGGPTGLDVFNDTRQTAYGLHTRLGKLAGNGGVDIDFLDLPIVDVAGEWAAPWNAGLGPEMNIEWL